MGRTKDLYSELLSEAAYPSREFVNNADSETLKTVIESGLVQVEVRTNFGVNAPGRKTAKWGFLILGKHRYYPDFVELEWQEGELPSCGCPECKLYGTDLPDVESVLRALGYIAKKYEGVPVRVHAYSKCVAFMSRRADSYTDGFHKCPFLDGLFTNFKKLYMEGFSSKGIDIEVIEDWNYTAPPQREGAEGEELNVENK